jgi:hypothetical protein
MNTKVPSQKSDFLKKLKLYNIFQIQNRQTLFRAKKWARTEKKNPKSMKTENF